MRFPTGASSVAKLRVEQESMTEPWVSVEDVANHLGVAKDSVYRWIETKGLPARRIGRLWKSKLSEVDQWVHAGGAAADSRSNTVGPSKIESKSQ